MCYGGSFIHIISEWLKNVEQWHYVKYVVTERKAMSALSTDGIRAAVSQLMLGVQVFSN
jgi:hypothetical protein